MENRPSEFANGDSDSYWQAAREGRLEFQQCQQCQHIQFPPKVHCEKCWDNNLSPYTCSGKGVIESVTTVERAPLPQFREKAPYLVVSVITAEGPRMITNLIGENRTNAAIGDNVEVTFEADHNGNMLPQWTLV
jgi:uncharacterized OB-fold protein